MHVAHVVPSIDPALITSADRCGGAVASSPPRISLRNVHSRICLSCYLELSGSLVLRRESANSCAFMPQPRQDNLSQDVCHDSESLLLAEFDLRFARAVHALIWAGELVHKCMRMLSMSRTFVDARRCRRQADVPRAVGHYPLPVEVFFLHPDTRTSVPIQKGNNWTTTTSWTLRRHTLDVQMTSRRPDADKFAESAQRREIASRRCRLSPTPLDPSGSRICPRKSLCRSARARLGRPQTSRGGVHALRQRTPAVSP